MSLLDRIRNLPAVIRVLLAVLLAGMSVAIICGSSFVFIGLIIISPWFALIPFGIVVLCFAHGVYDLFKPKVDDRCPSSKVYKVE